ELGLADALVAVLSEGAIAALRHQPCGERAESKPGARPERDETGDAKPRTDPGPLSDARALGRDALQTSARLSLALLGDEILGSLQTNLERATVGIVLRKMAEIKPEQLGRPLHLPPKLVGIGRVQ